MTNTAQAAQTARYDWTSIFLHWATAALVIALWGIGQTIDVFPKGWSRDAYRTLHFALGVTLALVVVVRLLWRVSFGRTLPPDPGRLGQIARLVHWGLYGLVAATLALGLFNVWLRGDMIVGYGRLAAFQPASQSLRAWVFDLHGLFANWILILAGLHAGAALLHHYVLRDDVLRRMLPRA